MFNGSPIFVRVRRYGQRFSEATTGAGWWLVMAPGIFLVVLALAILVWPELLAYLVASVLLAVGASLLLWGWQMRRWQQNLRRRQDGAYPGSIYEVKNQ